MATLSFLLIFLANFASAQDYDRGVEAYNNGDFQIALQAWLPLAEQGDARSQFNIGWMYDNAIGVRHSEICFSGFCFQSHLLSNPIRFQI